ncbi:MAG: cation diffusion facilitator family transporter [Sphingobacteriaceae bacterium]|nr:cation diffusion facilitator family transporter [Sphingobacteriaceae bacterium]
MQASHSHEIRFQRWLVVIGALLLVLKLVAWRLTGSNTIFSDAGESVVNVLAGAFTWYSLVLSRRPRDLNHPYGHGKIEFLAAGVEGALLGLAGFLIVGKSLYNLWFPQPLQSLDLGLALTAVAGLVNYILGSMALQRGRTSNSLPLLAGGKHLQADAWSTLAMVLGLGLVLFTGWWWLDSVVATLFGCFLLYTSYRILQPSVAGIMDEADEVLIERFAAVLQQKRQADWVDFHNLRLIKYGRMLHVDGHMTLPRYYDVERAHEEIERVDALIAAEFGQRVEFFIHVDPCLPSSCSLCAQADCPVRAQVFERQLDWTLPLLMENRKHRL